MTLIKSISGLRGIVGGKVGNCLSPLDIVRFVTAYVMWLRERYEKQRLKIILGRDGRISGPLYSRLVMATVESLGVDLIDIGLSTTPTVGWAVSQEKNIKGGIIITASHNPIEWNALKLLNSQGEPLESDALERLIFYSKKEDEFLFASVYNLGKIQRISNEIYIKKHIEAILNIDLVNVKAIAASNFTVVVDAINSSAFVAIPMLLESLGVKKVICLNAELKDQFAHNPEPLEEHLGELCSCVKQSNADMGIALDPDVDRLMFVCEDGKVFGEEYTLVAVADYVLEHKKGAVVSNLSSSRALKDLALEKKVPYYDSCVGEAYVIEKMKEKQAVIGGEGNGGVIYPFLHYGRDALIGIALFLSHLAHFKAPISKLKKKYSHYFFIKRKIELRSFLDADKLFEELKHEYKNYDIDLRDGIKISFEKEKESIHIRRSNTEPIIRLYIEGGSNKRVKELEELFINKIKRSLDIRR